MINKSGLKMLFGLRNNKLSQFLSSIIVGMMLFTRNIRKTALSQNWLTFKVLWVKVFSFFCLTQSILRLHCFSCKDILSGTGKNHFFKMLGLFNVKECSASFKTLKQEATGGGVTKRPEYLVGLSTFTILIPLLGLFISF